MIKIFLALLYFLHCLYSILRDSNRTKPIGWIAQWVKTAMPGQPGIHASTAQWNGSKSSLPSASMRNLSSGALSNNSHKSMDAVFKPVLEVSLKKMRHENYDSLINNELLVSPAQKIMQRDNRKDIQQPYLLHVKHYH